MEVKKESPEGLQMQGKYTKISNQQQIVFKAFGNRAKTMLEVSQETGILRANLCRYISDWQKRGMIRLHYFGICPISKHRAGFYQSVERGGQQ